MTNNNDLDIIDHVLNGDVDLFAEIVSKYRDRVFRYVYYRIYNYDEASDITQDIFIMTFEALHTFRRESKFYTWLFSIMVNYLKNYKKKSNRVTFVPIVRDDKENSFEMQLTDSRENPEREVINNDSLRILMEELAKLPNDYKEILLLRDVEGMPYNEISKTLGIKLSNVKVRIHRGRDMLKNRLKERGLI